MNILYVAKVQFKNCRSYVICRTGMEAERVCDGFSSFLDLINWSKTHRLLIYPEPGNKKIITLIQHFVLKSLLRFSGTYADFAKLLAACYSNPNLRVVTEPFSEIIENNKYAIEQIVNYY